MPNPASIHHAQEERTRRILVTPEGVDLQLKLAEAGQRITAFLLDLAFMMLVLVVATIAIAVGAIAGGPETTEIAGIIWLFGFFLLRNFYFIIMEMGPRAATYGKRICGVRVIARNGGRLTADAVVARNLIREIEFYLPLSIVGYNANDGALDTTATLFGLAWTCIFLFFPLFNRDHLRIGDLLAGTWVINAPELKLGVDLIGEENSRTGITFTDEQLAAYGTFELQTLERILRAGNPDAITTVAASIRLKIASSDSSPDAEFLTSYYDALRTRLERNLLFGRRRLDKFDR